jgi:cytochrome c peroxidase
MWPFSRFLLPAAALLLAVVACRPDADVVDKPTAAAYKFNIPTNLSAAVRVPASNPLTNEGVELGRFLFYEELLSADNSISCGSCHQPDKAFTDGRPFSRGVGGNLGKRSAMSLTNIMWVDSLNWDFRFTSIEAQNRRPLTHPGEMGQPLAVSVRKLQNTPDYPKRFLRAFGTEVITEELMLKALAQFQRTFISGQSKFDRAQIPGSGVTLTDDEKTGHALFSTHPNPYITPILRGGNCGDCHGSSGLFKTSLVSSANNGLDEFPADSGIASVTQRARDLGRFAVPTLRNIELTAPYMHDGRFATLEEVLDHYNEHVQAFSPNISREMTATNIFGGATLGLTRLEKRQIIAFLKTLTDTAFVNNKRFADPNP